MLESVATDWTRWDAAAKREGVNWSEYARRALEARTNLSETFNPDNYSKKGK